LPLSETSKDLALQPVAECLHNLTKDLEREVQELVVEVVERKREGNMGTRRVAER